MNKLEEQQWMKRLADASESEYLDLFVQFGKEKGFIVEPTEEQKKSDRKAYWASQGIDSDRELTPEEAATRYEEENKRRIEKTKPCLARFNRKETGTYHHYGDCHIYAAEFEFPYCSCGLLHELLPLVDLAMKVYPKHDEDWEKIYQWQRKCKQLYSDPTMSIPSK